MQQQARTRECKLNNTIVARIRNEDVSVPPNSDGLRGLQVAVALAFLPCKSISSQSTT